MNSHRSRNKAANTRSTLGSSNLFTTKELDPLAFVGLLSRDCFVAVSKLTCTNKREIEEVLFYVTRERNEMRQVLATRLCVGKSLELGVAVAALLLIASAVFGQSNPQPLGRDRLYLQFADSIEIEVAKQPRPRHAGLNTVTLQELEHVVPRRAQAEMEKAESALFKNRMDDAISHFNRAISVDPEFVAARNNLAVAYFTMARVELAIRQLESAIKTDPRRAALFANLALGYALIRQYDAAERAVRLAVDLDRAEALPSFLLGLVLTSQLKSNGEAFQYFEQAAGTYAEAHLFAARLLMAATYD
jgi:tetratricopeptide (TPR) repeat protein